MKKIYYLAVIAILLLLPAVSNTLLAQDDKKDKQAQKNKAITNAVQAQNYTFKAQTVLPMSGRTRQLTSEYDVRITKDSVISFLPYFGRAYGNVDPNSGGIQFTSTKFSYTVKDKKDGWDIIIKPSDARDVQQLSLSIFTGGSASLQVISTNRQPISFNGYVVAQDKK